MSSLGPPPGNISVTVDVAQTVAVAEAVIRVPGEVDNGGVTVRFLVALALRVGADDALVEVVAVLVEVVAVLVEVVAVLVEVVSAAKILAIAIVAGVV